MKAMTPSWTVVADPIGDDVIDPPVPGSIGRPEVARTNAPAHWMYCS